MSKYEVKPLIEPTKLRDDLAINEHNLSASMMTQAGLFSYYSTVAAQAQRQLDQLEHIEEIVLARLDKKIRDAASAAGTKITEAQVKAQVLLEPEAIQIRQAVNKAREVASVCKSGADAFRHRRDMMIQLAFNEREERKGEMRVTGGGLSDREFAEREAVRQRAAAITRQF